MTDDPILEIVRRCVTTVVPEIAPDNVTGDRTLAELGCDSVDRAEVVVMAMAEAGVVAPVAEFGRDRPISSIVDVLRRYR
jgi:polyketide biosynthesis acyl carrier protein